MIALGSMVAPALGGAKILSDEGIEAAVVNARFAKPLDADLICDVARTCGYIVTLEENAIAGGFGSALSEMLHQHGVCLPTLCLGLPDRFIDHARREDLLAAMGLDSKGIAERISAFVASRAHTTIP